MGVQINWDSISKREVSIVSLIQFARDLLDPKQEVIDNLEYARGIVELVTDAAGLPMKECGRVAREIGIPQETIEKMWGK